MKVALPVDYISIKLTDLWTQKS